MLVMKRLTKASFVLLLLLSLLPGVFAQDTAEEVEPPPGFDSWEAVLEAAEGTTVNWHLWGGSDAINEFVDTFYGPILEDEYGITLNRVPLNDTVDAVNQVIEEVEAGTTEGGGVDLIWINGENFYTLYEAELLYGPWAQNIPNSVLVDWENPAINRDFGVPNEGYESPWSSAQFQLIYDSERMSEEDLPRSYADLTEWIEANPGRFTYMRPGTFQGTRFIKQALYELSGGYEQWLGEFNEDLYNEYAPQLWEMLNEWEPNLWSEGTAYPETEDELHALFYNEEIDFSLTQAAAGAGPAIADGLIPETSRSFVFDQYMIGDFNYVAIPANANNIAGALVLANLILQPDRQAAQVIPENGFGLGYAIDARRVTAEDDVAALEGAAQTFGDAATDPSALSAALAPEIDPEYQTRLEADWLENVFNN